MATQEEWIKRLYGKEEHLWKFNFTIADLKPGGGHNTAVAMRPAGFIAVARAFAMGSMTLNNRKPGPTAQATYDACSNTLTAEINGSPTPDVRAAIVHECAHAVNDLFGPGDLTFYTDEASAFLVETIFRKSILGETMPKKVPNDSEVETIYAEADAIASKFWLYNGTPADLKRADYQRLRDAIVPVYDPTKVKSKEYVAVPAACRGK